MSLLMSPLLVVLLSAGTALTGCPTNLDWREYEGYCYWLSTYADTWYSAVNACPTVGSGSQLASIHSLLENAFIMETYNYAQMWIGFNDRSSEGSFVWSDGSDVDFTNWYPGQPDDNGHDGQDCTLMPFHGDHAEWDDNVCSRTLSFLCKMPATA